MKPEGNKVGTYASLNEKLQSTIAYKEEVKAESDVCPLLKNLHH